MENIIVAAAVIAAVVFLARSFFKKIKAFNKAVKDGASPCSSCGGCSGGECPSARRLSDKINQKVRLDKSVRQYASGSAFCAALAGFSTLALSAAVPSAFAADTTEAYGPGEISFEAHQSFEGFRDGRKGLGVGNEGLIGLGISDYLSAQVGFAFASNGYLAEGESEFSLTLLSTILDGDKFDLDLMLTAATGSISPGIELNFDATERFGVYLRAGASIFGGEKIITDPDDDPWEVDFSLGLTPGAYFNVKEGHQLLLEASFELGWCDAADHSGNLDVWSVALGYNFMVTEKIEIVTEVKTYHPDGGDQEFGIGFGVIASLP